MPDMIWKRTGPSPAIYQHDATGRSSAQRLSAWRDVLHDRSVGVVRDADAERLVGSIKGQSFGGGGLLARWRISQQTLIRTPEIARRIDNEYVFVSVMIEGQGTIEIGHETFEFREGDFAIIDATRPFTSVAHSALSTKGFLHVHRSALRDRLGQRDHLAFGVHQARTPLQKMTFSFLRDLTGLVGQVEPAKLALLANQTLDIIGLQLEDQKPGVIDPSTHQSGMLFRLKAYIHSHLRDNTLSLDTAAFELGVTPRYVNSLLAHEGTSFGRYLLGRRLEAAYRDICNPRFQHRQITEVAFDWGFNNATHFGKAFKDRFGMTPREAKSAALWSTIKGSA